MANWKAVLFGSVVLGMLIGRLFLSHGSSVFGDGTVVTLEPKPSVSSASNGQPEKIARASATTSLASAVAGVSYADSLGLASESPKNARAESLVGSRDGTSSVLKIIDISGKGDDARKFQRQRYRHAYRMVVQNELLDSKSTRSCKGVWESQKPCIPRCKKETPHHCAGMAFWQVFYEPSFGCALEERIGFAGVGGKWVCDPYKLQLKIDAGKTCLVYSIGNDYGFTFEAAVHQNISSSCEIHSIMGLPVSSAKPPQFVKYHSDEVVVARPVAKSLPELVDDLGHAGRTIDILHVSSNISDWSQFQSWFGTTVDAWQLLFKFTGHPQWQSNFHKLFAFLFGLGYVVFHKETETVTSGGTCVEYGFIKMGAQFSNAKMSEEEMLPEEKTSTTSSLSSKQSEGFMDEEDVMWKARRSRHLTRMRAHAQLTGESCQVLHRKEMHCLGGCKASLGNWNPAKCDGRSFWQLFYEPSFSCLFEERIGEPGEGGKWICDPHKLKSRFGAGERCLVYSIGSHGQFDFERAVHDEISSSCEIHTVDMQHWRKYEGESPPSYVTYHTHTVGTGRGMTNIPTLVTNLGHTQRTIDIFKIDCEGCEWTTYQSWFGKGVNIRQILVELHWKLAGGRIVSYPTVLRFFSYLNQLGYVVFHKEPNILGCKGSCIEYAFVKMSPEFTRVD